MISRMSFSLETVYIAVILLSAVIESLKKGVKTECFNTFSFI